jgi:hypothetical protein
MRSSSRAKSPPVQKTGIPVGDVSNLTYDQLSDELHLSNERISKMLTEEAPESQASKIERGFIRWGGVAVAILGVSVGVAVPPVGFGVAVGGLILTGWGEWRGSRDRKKATQTREDAKPIINRNRALSEELLRRKKPT